MEGAPQFPALIEEDGARLLKPVSYVTTGSHETFELMVRTMGEAQLPRSYCAPCSAMLLACPKGLTSTSSGRGNDKQQPVTTVIFSPRTPSEHRIFCADSQI